MLLSFIITAFATLSTVAFAYVSDSLPEKTINSVDRTFQNQLGAAWEPVRRTLRLRHSILGEKANRVKALQRFILTLSDQQLVTGYAIIVAAFAQKCTIKSWDFNLSNILAWYSALTHIITLIVLREYLHENKRMLVWRVIAMSIMMILLIGLNVMAFYVSWSGFPMMPVPCTWRLPPDEQDFNLAAYLVQAGIVIFLLCYYGTNFLGLAMNRRQGTLAWLYHTFRRISGKPPPPNRVESFNMHLLSQASFTGKRRQRIWHQFKMYFWKYLLVRAAFTNSFLWEAILMFALFAHLSGSMYIIRWENIPRWKGQGIAIRSDNSTVNFGQMVPLFLVALPFLGLVETIRGMHAPQVASWLADTETT